ncbi:hypothetical protein [Natronoglycomyces albus]|uniref:Uncharacterized protein n=1 Tax=Natronoglycomyces albus TaxID=2811108 RepID=A0A895XT91_9ACTN|nr:hypothetical protein [Natronoglycomyces albus]QSB05756.1 hypothetical protein JQS30_02160 [Natronoglycomyces albus]
MNHSQPEVGAHIGIIEMGHDYHLYELDRPGVVDIYRGGDITKGPIGRAHLTPRGHWWFQWHIFGDGSGAWVAAFRAKFEAHFGEDQTQ